MAVKEWSLMIGFIVVTVLVQDCRAEDVSREKLLRDLFYRGSYDSSLAPNFFIDKPTNVTVQLQIQDVAVRESAMELSVDLFLREWWLDTRLIFENMTERDRLELDSKMMEYVWTPDTFFSNEKKAVVHTVTTSNKLVHLYRNGTVLFSVRLTIILRCQMDFWSYPFDEQACPINVESYAYSDSHVVYRWKDGTPVIMPTQVGMPQFDLLQQAECLSGSYETLAGSFSTLSAVIFLKRQMGYYIIQVFVPSVLIVVLAWLSFWIDYDVVPARVSLGITTVLTMVTQSSTARNSLPQVSYAKAIDVWTAACLFFVFGSLLEYAYINVIARRKQSVPGTEAQSGDDLVVASGKKSGVELAREVDLLARILFPVMFLIFNLVFWCFFCM